MAGTVWVFVYMLVRSADASGFIAPLNSTVLYKNSDNCFAKLFKLIVAAYHLPFISTTELFDKSYL